MANSIKRSTPAQEAVHDGLSIGHQRNYNEVVDFLDAHWAPKKVYRDLATMQKLDQALGNPSKAIRVITVGGTNGKGLTIHFAAKLFKQEGLKVGAYFAPHILTYNERFTVNNETIANKAFTEFANEVINAAATAGVKPDSLEVLTMMAILYFKQNNVDIALLEMSTNTEYDPVNICTPAVVAITRAVDNHGTGTVVMDTAIKPLLAHIKPGTHVISADQSKLNLQAMQDIVTQRGGVWAMPIRKLAPLEYPFEQLHGRCAALAERICFIYINDIESKYETIAANSLLAKQKGQRGRPTLEAKRQAELNPKKTVDQFWKEEMFSLPAHFQMFDKEKPTILLDNARNVDALENLLLGIRLLHYQRPLKGLALIFGCDKNLMDTEEFLRALRYFSKKNSAHIIFCPIDNNLPGVHEESWDVETVVNDIKSLKIKAKSAPNFVEAFETAKKLVNDRNGLVVIAGSQTVITQYWQTKGIKKL